MSDETKETTIDVTLTLDDAHDAMVSQLESSGVDVEDYLSQRLQAPADKAIHDLFSQSKYQQQQ